MVRLYDDNRTFDTIVIVLANRQEGKPMNEHKIDTTPAAAEAPEKDQRGPSASHVAAVVEAAYILEAVRK
jgi:hypothetical protein